MATGQAARSAAMPQRPAIGDDVSHLAFFYHGQRDYLARIQAFALAGLANGDAVLIALPGENCGLLREHLGDGTRRLHYADMARLGRNPARIIPEVRDFVDAHHGQRIRYVGEPIWPGRSAAEIREATRHEALLNLAFPGTAATILCPYDAAGLPRSVIREAERTHPAILANGYPIATGSYAGPGNLPPDCERPLPPPPGAAETLRYETDLRPIRALVADHARRAGLPGDRTDDLVLAVSELAGNTLRHTDGGGTVHVWHTGEEVLCQIHDQGWITDPLAGRTRRPADERGHGLWVVNQVCDLVELRTGRAGTTVRLHMTVQDPSPV
jgi:anti-sigma regulatory factor (Ser/Thr protein kinase)